MKRTCRGFFTIAWDRNQSLLLSTTIPCNTLRKQSRLQRPVITFKCHPVHSPHMAVEGRLDQKRLVTQTALVLLFSWDSHLDTPRGRMLHYFYVVLYDCVINYVTLITVILVIQFITFAIIFNP